MNRPELLDLWTQLFKQKAPGQVRSELLIRIIAYRIQELAYGGLSAATRRRLKELAQKFEANPNAEIPGIQRIKPGTRLIRKWRDQVHQVTVVEKGYTYHGKRYRSLSQIARLITGTRWSGPLFFGLRTGRTRGGSNGR